MACSRSWDMSLRGLGGVCADRVVRLDCLSLECLVPNVMKHSWPKTAGPRLSTANRHLHPYYSTWLSGLGWDASQLNELASGKFRRRRRRSITGQTPARWLLE